jgi:hypothetical protein
MKRVTFFEQFMASMQELKHKVCPNLGAMAGVKNQAPAVSLNGTRSLCVMAA